MAVRLAHSPAVATIVAVIVAVGGAACGDVRIYPLRHDTPGGTPECPTSMVGYAIAGAGGPTTGGMGGDIVVASTADELAAYAMMEVPLIIKVQGLLTLPAAIHFASDKTLYGDPATPGTGITGAGLNLTDASNIIVRNLQISKATADEGDAITILRSRHIWIDHCDLSSERTGGNYDGLVDITHASEYVTVSWTNLHDHRDTSLVGHSADNMVEDTGHLTVTFHHNLYRNVLSGPRIRFGTAHIYNNQFQDISDPAGFGVASESNATTVVQGNLFRNVALPITTMYKDEFGGLASDVKNRYVSSGFNNITAMPQVTPPFPYDYIADAAESVPALVPFCVGIGHVADPLADPPAP